MTDLNNTQALRDADSLGSLAATENYHRQFAHALELAGKWELPAAMERNYHEIVVLGTGGGSSIAGGMLTSLFFHQLKQPVIINQGYNLPAFADNDSLVVALSHSGNTEEIMSALGQAYSRGCPALAITAGGALAEVCAHEGIPHLLVPKDIGHPRRDLGYILVPLLAALHRLGLVPDLTPDILETVSLMEQWAKEYGADNPVDNNPAKQLALKLKGRIPLIYGSPDHLQAVAWRWKNQFGENSKLMAFYNLIPHVHHDEAVGWDMEQELLGKFFLIMLRDDKLDLPQVRKRKAITREMLSERMGGVEEVWARGDSLFARLSSLIHLGDFVSLYAAVARGIDPTPVAVINLFKDKMGQ